MAIDDTIPEPPYSLGRLLRDTGEPDAGERRFAPTSARMLGIDVDGGVWLKPGAAVAYRGALTFERRPTLGAVSPLDAVLREAAPLTRAIGRGRLYCGHHGLHVHVVRLAGESIVVSWQDLLAFEESLAFTPSLVGGGVGIAAGGLIAITLSGCGAFALAAHGHPLSLHVGPGDAVSTDPHATLAWSSDLAPALKTDLSWRSAFGHGGHEPVQMLFEGSGFVIVQPHEDASRLGGAGNPIKRLAAAIAG